MEELGEGSEQEENCWGGGGVRWRFIVGFFFWWGWFCYGNWGIKG